jgi:hypothetical protein
MVRSSVQVAGHRYAGVADDALISMAYARNAVEGYGLDWGRRGERVEGFSHPLWLGVMVALQGLPLERLTVPFVLQGISLLLLLANVVLCWRYLEGPLGVRHVGVQAVGLLLIAAYYPLDYWALEGMETGLQAVLLMAVMLTLVSLRSREMHRGHLLLGLLLACCYLVRMDMALLAVVAYVWLWRAGVLARDRRIWLVGPAILVSTAIGYQIFRVAYFDAWLPNTYYLKLAGIPLAVRLARGSVSFGRFLGFHLLFVAGAAIVALRERGRREVALPLWAGAAFAAYVIWIGGDVWDFSIPLQASRFLAFAVPPVLLVACVGLDRLRQELESNGRTRLVPLLLAAAGAVAIVSQLDLRTPAVARESIKAWSLADQPPQAVGNAVVLERLAKLSRIAPNDASVAVYWAGIPAYYSDYRMVDILGYNDRRIARQTPRIPLSLANWDTFVPGHFKWDYDYLLREVRPDAFLHLWGMAEEGRQMSGAGYRRVEGFWVRADAAPRFGGTSANADPSKPKI